MNKCKRTAPLARSLAGIAAVALALAQGVPAGSEPPKLHGETLDGHSILLPDAAAGKVTLLVLGASRRGGERTGPWKNHFVADFGPNPIASYYVAALLQSVPGPFRGMIRSGMRSGTPVAAQGHVLISGSDDDAWKKYLGIHDTSVPAVLLLDGSGHVRWSYIGAFDPSHYETLRAVAEAMLEGR